MDTLRGLDLELVRALSTATEIREASEGSDALGIMEVRFSVFDTWYEINSVFEGRFLERTVAGAFKKTISERSFNIKVLYDHGHDVSVGNKVLGSIDYLREESGGPRAEVGLFDTSYNRDLLPGLRAGAYGSSFRFRVIKDEWNDEPDRSDHNPEGLPERTVKEVKLYEFGPVTFPANPDSTAGMRSMTDQFYAHIQAANHEAMVARAKLIRTPNTVAAESTSANGAAQIHDLEPVSDHSRRIQAIRDSRLKEWFKDASFRGN